MKNDRQLSEAIERAQRALESLKQLSERISAWKAELESELGWVESEDKTDPECVKTIRCEGCCHDD